MRLFNQVAIIGVGLIGGSLGLSIKKKRLADNVIGVSRHKKTLFLAKKSRAIDEGAQEIKVIKDADLVIFATPVNTILKLAPLVAKIIKPGCIVTDVGSTKKEIVVKLDKIFKQFVGSHPLAGSEKRGILYAHADIFKDSLCLLTPSKKTNLAALAKIKKLWSRLGAKTVILSPENHDQVLSFTSHLPHILAFALLDIVPARYLGFASSGLKDTTRIAASDSQLWTDIILTNAKNIIQAIDLFEGNLEKMKKAIRRQDRKLLFKIIKKAKSRREAL